MLDPQDYTGTYKVVAGELCLEFANTVSWRGQDKEHDWLHNVSNYIQWGHLVGILSNDEVVLLQQQATENPDDIHAELEKSLVLRETIDRIFHHLSQGKQPQSDDIDLLNRHIPEALKHLQVQQHGDEFEWGWTDTEITLAKLRWVVVWSASNLLMSDQLERLGTCDGCDWLFIDTSRNRSRRWCTMEDCGNRAKVRRHRRQN